MGIGRLMQLCMGEEVGLGLKWAFDSLLPESFEIRISFPGSWVWRRSWLAGGECGEPRGAHPVVFWGPVPDPVKEPSQQSKRQR